jgi:hypothetical protein
MSCCGKQSGTPIITILCRKKKKDERVKYCVLVVSHDAMIYVLTDTIFEEENEFHEPSLHTGMFRTFNVDHGGNVWNRCSCASLDKQTTKKPLQYLGEETVQYEPNDEKSRKIHCIFSLSHNVVCV